MTANANKDVIIACDFKSKDELFAFLEKLGGEKPYLKIGMEIFYAEGAPLVRELKKRGYKIFLDLKLHDIPNTVTSAMRVLSGLDVDMVNVHAQGGAEMMKGALQGLVRSDGTRPLIIAVTLLTSISPETLEKELKVTVPLESAVSAYAENVKNAGLDGVVCSTHEVKKVKAACGENFIAVTPGIRFENGENADQKRVATPSYANEVGSDYIVVGRPITRAANPLEAYLKCKKEFMNI